VVLVALALCFARLQDYAILEGNYRRNAPVGADGLPIAIVVIAFDECIVVAAITSSRDMPSAIYSVMI